MRAGGRVLGVPVEVEVSGGLWGLLFAALVLLLRNLK